MNYTAKFGSGASDTFSSAGIDIDSLAHHGGGDTVTIPDAHLLFSGDYSRSGSDLIVSDQLHRVVVPNYFHGDKHPRLVSPDGAPLDPKVIEALTGHVQYAQAAGTAAAGKVVGHVVKMTGSASIVRNGVTITLNDGDNVYQNDVVQTGSGSTLGLVLIDGTTFNLNAGARLMLNDLTYEAGSTSNSSLFTLVQGAASFVAGQVAKTGDMKVGTPVATMGIRGTAVILDISAVDGRVSVSVVDQHDGQIHAVQVFNTRGILIGTVTSNGTGLTLTPVANFEVIAQESNKTPAQVALEFNTLQGLLQTYEFGRQLFPDLPQHTDNANPQSPTRYASSTPSDSPYTERASFVNVPGGAAPPADGGTHVQVVATLTGSGPIGLPTPSSDPVTFHVDVPAAPLPFVVTPPTVNRISGDGGDHFGPVMSADGQSIVYDPDGSIFLYNQQTHTTTVIAQAGNGFTYSGQTISADGHFIAFQGSNGTQSFVFIYNNDPSDTAHYQHTIQLVAGGAPAISGDGSIIVVEHGGNSIGIYDQQGHVLATVTPAAIGHTGAVWSPAISADGHMIAFWNNDGSTPGGSGHLFTYDLSTGTVTEIASTTTDAGNSAASFSADGHYVVYQSAAPGGHSEIYLYDLSTGQVVFHTANASGESYNPVLSPDGHFIIFASDARLLPDDDTNAVADTYVVDVSDPDHPVYRLVSNLGTGSQPDGASNLGAAISAGGLFVAFGSSASNLSQGDTPGTGDIFLADSTSGRSAIIQESSTSPAVLTANGVIALTGDHNGVTLGVSDPSGRFTASFDAQGNIQWNFSEPRSDFAALLPGQISIQNFTITLNNGSGTTTIPVRVSVYDADQPVISVVANPGTIAGDNGNNTLTGTVNNDVLQGFGGDDTIIGLTGVDRAVYTDATGGITVDLAAGTVSGQGVGTDTLVGIEAIQGSNFVDHYSAAGFTGVSGVPGVPIGFNSFEGMAGDDIITGNVNVQGQALTRISYASATAAVTVDFAAGTATGDVSVGSDHFTNVNAVIGSGFADILRGSDNLNGTYEQYDGRGGNDLIDGRGGYDFATYNNDPATHSGIAVNLAAGTVVGDASVGTDTLRGVEGVRGTNFADTYNAVGFNGSSINAGSLGTFNNFDGAGGDDAIYGNGNTRVQYTNATAAVLVDLADTGTGGTGVAMDLADAINHTNFDLASVGVDTIHGGVNAVMGSMFGDSLLGSANNENFQGLGGDDYIDGRGGFDNVQYNNPTYVTGGISVDMVHGTVTGDASVGTDTLRSIEGIQGTNFNDSYDASHFGLAGYLNSSLFNVGNFGVTNNFEGLGGDDTITGNGFTTVIYANATAGVTVDLAAGTAQGTAPGDLANVGHDIITGGVNVVIGSNFGDTLLGSDNDQGTIEHFYGRGGNDTIDGRGGFDQADYSIDPATLTTGITVHMAVSPGVGTVDGDAQVGHDTLISVESVVGTRLNDIYDALNFSGFNEFQGLAGNDQITGNGFTQLGYYGAASGVTVDMALGTADGDASVGHDTFSGVNEIRGSNWGDTFRGDAGNDILDGLGGNDLLDGRGGNDMLIGGTGADTFVYAAGYGADAIADFNRVEGDRIDLTGLAGVDSLAGVLATAVQTEFGATVLNFGGYDSLTLYNVTLTSLTASDFIFATHNTAPTVISADGDSAGADLTEADSKLTAQGTETVNDPDGTDTVSVSVSGVDHTGPTGGLSDATLLSYFSVPATAVLSGGQTSGHFTWNFDSHGQAFDFLAAGETLSLHYTIVPDDGHAPTGTGNGVVTINIVGTNDAPVFTGDAAGTTSQGGAPVAIATNVSASDVDSDSYNGGSLTATVTAGGHQGDTLSIANTQFISLDGANVMFDSDGSGDAQQPVLLGVLTSNYNTLTVTLNNNAGDAAVAALTQAIQFENSLSNPVAGTRTVTFTLDDGGGTANGGHDSSFFNATVDVAGHDQAPTVAGDMSIVAVTGGGEVALTVADLNAVDPDTDPANLTFTVDHLNHGRLTFGDDRVQLGDGDTFTLADVQAGRVYYQSVGGYVGQDHITLSLSDGVAPPVTAILGATIVNAQFTVLTADGYNFDQDDPIGAMGRGNVVPDGEADPAHSFRIVNGPANRDFIVTGSGFVYNPEQHRFTAGTITSIQEVTHNSQTPLATFAMHVPAADWYDAVVAQSNGNQGPIEALVSQWTFNFVGNSGADAFFAGDANDIFTGRAGNDTLGGEFGYDRANYGGATGPIDVQLADGIVTGTGADASGVGTDTLQSIEMVTGTNYDDAFNAGPTASNPGGFNSGSSNAGSTVTNNVAGMFNEFEGRGGTDTITGNGQTRVSYYHATAGVTVTFDANSWTSTTSGGSGIATGDASVGTDHFTGVNQVRGSFFNDTFHGSNNPGQTTENFEGLGGDDLIDGGGGFDRAQYFQAADDTGISVNLAAGTVTGGIDTGTDTLRSIEAIYGTNFADTYDATGFVATATVALPNAGSAGVNGSGAAFNEFEGGGGDDSVIGNGNTRVAFYHATGGVVVALGANGSGAADGNDSVGHDTFASGVSAVRGSEFNDIITGNGGNNTLEGQGGNDVLNGRGGNDNLTGGTGADIFVFGPGNGVDTVNDFHRGEGDRLDLRGYNFTQSQITQFFLNNVHLTNGNADTIIDLDLDHPGTNTILLRGVQSNGLDFHDIIFNAPGGPSVAVAVQTPDGYDFSTLYGDMAASDPHQSQNDATHIFAVSGSRTLELIGSFSYANNDPLNGAATGTITEIDILDTADPTRTTQDHVLVNTNGWSIDAADLFTFIGQYNSQDSGTHDLGVANLNGIFNAATYSIVGTAGFADNHSKPHDGADVFFGGNQADVFNGMPGPFGWLGSPDPGSDTVDYSHATAAVSVNLFDGATSGAAAAGDIFISIENLRGSNFDDTLIGDGQNNVLEGGLGDDTLDGGANGLGVDTASYEHATAAVSVSLVVAGRPQTTGGAGTDTLINIEGLRGSNFDDTLTGNGSNVLEGGLGDDHLIGHAGETGDTASYAHASSGVTVDLSTPNPQNTGGAGTDTLTNIANLTGSQFNDTLTGDTYNNVFFGNGGNDTFVFNESGPGSIGHDTIGDFMSGQDHIQLNYAAFDPNDASSFNDWYTSHVTLVPNTGDLLINLNGQDTIRLQNASFGGLHANDFILPASVGH